MALSIPVSLLVHTGQAIDLCVPGAGVYYFSTQTMTYAQAKTWCEGHTASNLTYQLVSLETETEKDLLYQAIQTHVTGIEIHYS